VMIPGAVGDGEETTPINVEGCDAGPLGLMGVTTGRYPAPQPATNPATATAPARTAPASTNRKRAWPVRSEEKLIRYRSCLPSDCKSGKRDNRPAAVAPNPAVQGRNRSPGNAARECQMKFRRGSGRFVEESKAARLRARAASSGGCFELLLRLWTVSY